MGKIIDRAREREKAAVGRRLRMRHPPGGIVFVETPPEPIDWSRVVLGVAYSALLLFLGGCLVVLLTACGGGGDEDDTRKWEPINCQKSPEACK